jgi:hypothetical protein
MQSKKMTTIIEDEILDLYEKIEYNQKVIDQIVKENEERRIFLMQEKLNPNVREHVTLMIMKKNREKEQYSQFNDEYRFKIQELENKIKHYEMNEQKLKELREKNLTIQYGLFALRILDMDQNKITIESNNSTEVSVNISQFNNHRSALIFGIQTITNKPKIEDEVVDQVIKLYQQRVY